MNSTVFDDATLRAEGFVGWIPVHQLPRALRHIPTSAGGVYIVTRASHDAPDFLDTSPAGRFRGDPSVPIAVLTSQWIDGCRLLYIGKGNHGRLQARLRELESFGRGTRARHWGGRLIWQLRDSTELHVAWKELPVNVDPLAEERAMLARFRAIHGRAPFANDPHLR